MIQSPKNVKKLKENYLITLIETRGKKSLRVTRIKVCGVYELILT